VFEKANGLAWRVERTGGLPQQSWEAISLLQYNVAAASDGVEAEKGPALCSKSMFRRRSGRLKYRSTTGSELAGKQRHCAQPSSAPML
jgi:hypothetical protein